MNRPSPLFLAALCALATSAQAQTTTTDADTPRDYVVTGARQPQARADVVRPVTVITAQDIRLSGQRSLLEVLQTYGGVEMAANGGLGQTGSLFIRGASSEHTVVLIDGVRIGSATLGTASLDALPLDLIERVEVLQGPSSSLYGSDAIGGVVQIFTKSAERSPGVSLALTGGSNGLSALTGSFIKRYGSTDVALSLGTLHTNGYDVTTPDHYAHNPDRDGYRTRQGSLRLTHKVNDAHELSAQLMQAHGRSEYDDGATVDALIRQTVQTASTQWRARWSPVWLSELRLARSWDKSESVSTFSGVFNTTQDQLSWQNTLSLGGNTVILGAESLRQAVDSDTNYDVKSRRINSVFGGWRGKLGDHALQADLRHDGNSQFGDHITGQLGWGWQLLPDLRLRAAYGTAFHAPTFNVLYYPFFGVPTLTPERSRSTEVGADWQLGNTLLGLTWFDNRISDLIIYPPPTYVPTNVARARIRGVTATVSSTLASGTRLKASVTAQNPESRDTGYQLQRRSRVYGSASVIHPLGDSTRVGVELTGAGTRYDNATESVRMGGYTVVSLFAAHSFSPSWALEGRINNATDKRYELVQNYVPPRANAQLTLRWTPGL